MKLDFEVLLYCLTGVTAAAVAMLVGWHWSISALMGIISGVFVAFVSNSGLDL